jgi:hypothetical protein
MTERTGELRRRSSRVEGASTDETYRGLAVTGLSTLQFLSGGLMQERPVDGYRVHLVRSTERGTPGPTLCGIDRFHPDTAGWSVGGGLSGPGITHERCPGCAKGLSGFVGLPISGLGHEAFDAQVEERPNHG